jgi:hypothetical protein
VPSALPGIAAKRARSTPSVSCAGLRDRWPRRIVRPFAAAMQIRDHPAADGAAAMDKPPGRG